MSTSIDFKKLTLMDALDLAILIEEEALERYEQFAEQMGSRYQGDAGDFFESMKINEGKHAKQLMERRQKLFKDAPRRVDSSMIWDVEAPDPNRPRSYMSPRQAMELALESEIKAYRFFDEALRTLKDEDVKKLFKELREEEKEHQAAIQKHLARMPEDEGPDRAEEEMDEPGAQD